VSAAGVRGMRCGACGGETAPPQPVCPKCGRDDRLTMREIPGEGRLYSFTIVRVPPEGLEHEAPYALGIVELEGGARITARIETPEIPSSGRAENGPKDAFDRLAIDGRVRLVREEKGVYFFSPAP